MVATGRISAVGAEYIRKMRDFKFNEALYNILLKQYETARLDEAQDPVFLQTIEEAIPPEKRVKPKRMMIVMIATVTGFFFQYLWHFY